MTSKKYRTTLIRNDMMCLIPVPFDPKAMFGKIRAPVTVTLNGYTYRSTIATMGGPSCIPLRKSHREAAGLDGTETLEVLLTLDTDERTVEVPDDLVQALKKARGAWEKWEKLSYTHRKEHVEAVLGAKQEATRVRRVQKAVELLLGK
ncbi:MAG TPA: YdeI/OmpD-associated family protein [Candidatus Acidoferrum sp.]|nr:YdeI/OmpD-associated family protein [Candidatus Acidoferrum sp.]